SLPPLPPSPAPPCIPCVEGRQRADPHTSSFPSTEAPLQTLHLDVWGPARVRGQGHERYFLLVVDDGGQGHGGGSGGGGGGGGGAGRGGAAQRGGFGGSQRQQQPRSRETPSAQQLREWYAGRGRSGGVGPCTYVLRTGERRGETCGLPHTAQRCFSRMTDAWRAQFPDAVELPCWGDLLKQNIAIFDLDFDAILAVMYAVADIAEGDCYLCVPPDPGIEAAALGASASAAPGTSESAAPGTSESAAPGAGESALSGTAPTEVLHTFTLDSGASRSFFRDSTRLTPLSWPVAVSLADPLSAQSLRTPPRGADLQDAWVDQFTPGGQRVTHCTCSRTGSHLAMFTRQPGSSLYTLTTASPPATASCQVAASGQVFSAAFRSSPASAPCSCRPLSHETLLWHHRLGHPSLPRLRGMASRTLGHERYFLLVVDDYSRYTTFFPLRRKDRGGEFSSKLLRAFCHAEGIRQTFTLPASPQQNGIAKRRIGMVMDVARTSMIHAAASHFLWPFAVQYAAHQINLQPRVSLPQTTPTLWWTGKVGDVSVFRVKGSRAFVRDASADKLSSRAVPCVFLGFLPDAPGCVSQVDPVEPVEVAVDSGAARGGEHAGAGPESAEPGVAESVGAEPGGAEPERVEPGGAELGGAESGGADPGGTEPERTESGGPLGVSSRCEPLSPQQLREWYARSYRRAAEATRPAAGGAAGAGATGGAASAAAAGGASGAAGGAAGAGAAGAAGPGGAVAGGTGTVGGPAGVGAAGGAGAAGPGGACTGGTGAAGAAGAAGAGAVAAGGATGAGGAVGVVAGDPRAEGTSPVSAPASPLPGPSPYSGPTRGLTERRESESRPTSPESRPESLVRPRVPLPSSPASSLPALADPESDSLRAASPTDTRLLATVVSDPSFESTAVSALVGELVDFAAHCRLDYAASLVADSESASVCPPSVGGECSLGRGLARVKAVRWARYGPGAGLGTGRARARDGAGRGQGTWSGAGEVNGQALARYGAGRWLGSGPCAGLGTGRARG
ncbi:unnamed protein product, partial [Closterium sp. NIES-53]